MPAFLQELLAQLKGIWARLDGGQRATIISVMAAAVVGLSALVWYAQQPDWQQVYYSNDFQERAEVMAALAGAGVETKINDVGGIEVQSTDRERVNAAMATAGIGGEGGSGALEASMTDPEDVRKEKIFRNKVEEVRRKIVRSRDVREAHILASLEQRHVYTRLDDERARLVTVKLDLRSGAMFEQVAKFARDAVAAQLGRQPEDVIVYGSNGQTLGGRIADGGASGTVEAQAEKRAYSRKKKAQAQLDKSYQGLALVEVAIELDNKITRTTRPYESESPAVLSQTTRKKTSSDPRSTPSGDPSTAAATGLANGSVSNASAVRSEKSEDSEVTYASGEIEERQADFPIRRMTVSLVLDKDIPRIAEVANDPAALAAEVKKIEDVVKAAVGFVEDRDTLHTDYGADIAPPAELPPISTGPGVSEIIESWGPTALQIGSVAVVLFFLRGLLKNATPKRALAAVGAGAGDGGVTPQTPEQSESREDQTRRMRREIERSIADDPAAVSRLLEAWLAEQPS